MPNSARRAPIIVIGMHRSGTAVVSRLLGAMGVFMGAKREANDEAVLFVGLNDWLLRESGGRWDYPEPVRSLLTDPEIRQLAKEYVSEHLRTLRAVSYLGWLRYLRYRTLDRLPHPWGWKDPRTTFTLPLYLELFPGARVIHVLRHGVDVARSLQMRRAATLRQSKALWQKRRAAAWLRPNQIHLVDSVRCRTLEDGFALWETYAAEARRQLEPLGAHGLEIRYEELLAHPDAGVDTIAAFCGVRTRAMRGFGVTGWLDRTRVYAHRADPELRRYAAQVAERLAVYGYDAAAVGSLRERT